MVSLILTLKLRSTGRVKERKEQQHTDVCCAGNGCMRQPIVTVEQTEICVLQLVLSLRNGSELIKKGIELQRNVSVSTTNARLSAICYRGLFPNWTPVPGCYWVLKLLQDTGLIHINTVTGIWFTKLIDNLTIHYQSNFISRKHFHNSS